MLKRQIKAQRQISKSKLELEGCETNSPKDHEEDWRYRLPASIEKGVILSVSQETAKKFNHFGKICWPVSKSVEWFAFFVLSAFLARFEGFFCLLCYVIGCYRCCFVENLLLGVQGMMLRLSGCP